MADSTRAMRQHIIDRDILPVFRNRLRSLAQAEALQIEGAAAAVTPQRPAPVSTPAPSELARRKAKLQAELSAKKERTNQRKGRGR
jgi:hypothetical protein